MKAFLDYTCLMFKQDSSQIKYTIGDTKYYTRVFVKNFVVFGHRSINKKYFLREFICKFFSVSFDIDYGLIGFAIHLKLRFT